MKDPLTHSDPAVAAVLERARRGLAPTDTERERLLSRLPLTLDTPPLAPSSPQGTESALAGKSLAGGVVSRFVTSGFVAGVAVGIGVGFGGGFWANSALRGDVASPVLSPVESAPSYAPVNEEASHVNAANKSVVVSSASEVGPVPPQPPRVWSKSDAGLTRGRDVNAPKDRAANPSLFTNDDELAYVRRAQTALRHNNGALALALMRTLDEVLPRGALLAERNVTRVLALCQTGRVEEARVLARRVLRSDPTASVYAARLAASCAHIDDSAQND